jgi:MFS family permease
METGKLQSKWITWRSAPWWPAILLILVQTLNGMWYMPQLSFFPVYLQDQLGLSTAAIGGLVAGAQVAGMIVALLGGWVTGLLGSKWVLVCGLALSGVASFAFQIHAPWVVAALWFIGGAGLALITVGGASYLTRVGLRGTLGVLAAFYALSMTIGGAIGTPIAGVIIERRGFSAFGWAETLLIACSTAVATLFMLYLGDRTAERASLRVFWAGALAMVRRSKIRNLLGLRCLPTIFYGMLTVLIPVLLNTVSGSKVVVAAYATTNLIVASAAQLLAGRSADRWGARGPTLVAYTAVIVAGVGLAITVNTVWGLFVFGVLGVAAAWSLSTLMYIWVKDGVAPTEHASSYGLLHAVWSLSMITGSLLGGSLVRAFPGLPFLIASLLNVGSILLALAYYALPAARSVSSPVPADPK